MRSLDPTGQVGEVQMVNVKQGQERGRRNITKEKEGQVWWQSQRRDK